jgi:hypothetical protein
MMVSSFAHISPHLLGLFMLALACVPLVFVLQDKQRRATEQKRMAQLRREARIAAELRGRGDADSRVIEGWVGQAPR